jgi:hypothetical protein
LVGMGVLLSAINWKEWGHLGMIADATAVLLSWRNAASVE